MRALLWPAKAPSTLPGRTAAFLEAMEPDHPSDQEDSSRGKVLPT